jgi:hypothetical protein
MRKRAVSRIAFGPFLAALALGGLSLACTEEKQPNGQLMIAFDSDMAVPKDVNVAEFEAEVGPVTQGTNFELGPPGSRLPATLGVRMADNKRQAIELSLNAGKDQRLRTVGLVQTTVPDDRIALVRMPIQWLCTLRVSDVDEETRASDCEPDETCNAGRCEPAVIPEEDLPTYDPQDVFGGGVGDGTSGLCFDTQESFRPPRGLLVTSEIDRETCRIAIPDESFNFALRVRGGDGICIDNDLCLVTLNRSKVTGWYEVNEDGEEDEDGGLAQLPTIICEELEPGTGAILGVYAGPFVPQKVPEIPLCAPWSSAGLEDPDGSGNPDGGGGGKIDPDELCPELGSGKPGADIVEDPIVASFMDLSTLLVEERRTLFGDLGRACVAIAGGLGAEDVWGPLGFDPEQPTEQSVQAACTSALASLVDAVVDVERMKVGLTPTHCVVSPEDQADCESACSPAAECQDDQRCPDESSVGECSGECQAGSYCEGALNNLTSCNGLCLGVCKGTCEGLCTRLGEAAPCEGVCELGACVGQCAGDCYLDLPTSCGTGTQCRGECDEEREVVCSSPLGACAEIDPNCSTICALNAATTATCSAGGHFTAETPLEVQDADLEDLLRDDILPELRSLSLVSRRAALVLERQGDFDFGAIEDLANEAGVKEGSCTVDAIELVVPTLEDLAVIQEYAEAILDAVLAIRAQWPLECEVLRANGDECQQCIAENCCPELSICQDDPRCLEEDLETGEAPCVINCVADDTSDDPEQVIRQRCATMCITPTFTELSATTVNILLCLDSNVGGSCEDECYGTEP